MSKKEKQAYRKGAREMLFSILGMGIWIVMIITYIYIKFM